MYSDMNAYKYSDNEKNWEPLFIAVTVTIAEADASFKAVMGFDVTKKPNIGCSIEFDVNEEDYVQHISKDE